MQLLVLSNGHGEDAIAVQIIDRLQHHHRNISISALPLVGVGHAYSRLNIPIVGRVQQMPSGGFVYMDGRQLLGDLRGGLLQLTREQYQVVRHWSKTGGKILAVGDIVPLLFAWSSGAEYAFVGTAKSEYYIRDEQGWLPRTSLLDRCFGSVFLPWDCWLMSRPRCKAVFPRDSLTTTILQQRSIPAFDLGNPMMDGLETRSLVGAGMQRSRPGFSDRNDSLTILLLPGSRMPEAEANWQKIVASLADVIANFYVNNFASRAFIKTNLTFLAAIAPGLPIDRFAQYLTAQGWNPQPLASIANPIADPQSFAFTRTNATLILSQNTFADCAQASDLAIAMAGTAIEQFVGLGKPAIAISGKGPQFTYAFAEAQTRLLGCSVTLVKQPQQVAPAIQTLMENPDLWQQIYENGRRRMGESGAAGRIAHCLVEKLFRSR